MKKLLVIILLLMSLKLIAQNRQLLPGAVQRWRELNLSAEQKRQIRLILQRQRIQQELDKAELDRILTPEQKRKLKEWKKKRKEKNKLSS